MNRPRAAHPVALAVALVPALVLGGCTSSAPGHGLPSATIDGPSSAPAATKGAGDVRPCGYDYTIDTALLAQPFRYVHDRARITYDGAGRDVLEQAVDDDNHFAFRYATAYDAMGNPVIETGEFADRPTSTAWLVYDSFGRLIRYSGDDNGDGTEDWATTYRFGDDGYRASAHVASAAQTYDRSYHYDDKGRLIELDRDDGPDGVIDQITRFAYDDARRVMAQTVTDMAGTVIDSGTTMYDGDDHIVSAVENKLDAAGSPYTVTDGYRYVAGKLVSERHATSATSGSSRGEIITSYQWTYDRCP